MIFSPPPNKDTHLRIINKYLKQAMPSFLLNLFHLRIHTVATLSKFRFLHIQSRISFWKAFGTGLHAGHVLVSSELEKPRVAQCAGIGELDSSIAKDLIDSEEPKHTLFSREKRICRDLRAF